MLLRLHRQWFTSNSTIGELTVDGQPECFVLEDPYRADGVKVPGATCIPRGLYQIQITFSNRFQRELPLLLHVPGFEGIRIHPGNKPADTEGCLLPGKTRMIDFVSQSREAFNSLFEKLQDA